MGAGSLRWGSSSSGGACGRRRRQALARRLRLRLRQMLRALEVELTAAPRLQLGLLGVTGGLCAFVVAAFTPQWSFAAILAVSMLFGMTAVAWNGVFLAEVSRLSPEGGISEAVGGVQAYMFWGAVGGPILFSGLVMLFDTYSIGFVVFGVPPLVSGLRLMLRPAAQNARG